MEGWTYGRRVPIFFYQWCSARASSSSANKYILIDFFVCSIAKYFFELCCATFGENPLASLFVSSKELHPKEVEMKEKMSVKPWFWLLLDEIEF